MFKRTQHFILVLIMVQLVLGAAAWMYTAHLCKYDDGCGDTATMACCGAEDTFKAPELPSKGMAECHQGNESNCCYDVNTYINFPLYFSKKTELPMEKSLLVFLGDFCSNTVEVFQKEDHSLSDIYSPKSEAPPDKKWLFLSVFRI